MDCGGTCMKYLLFIFNFVFFVTGAAILGVSIWAKLDPTVTEYIGVTIEGSSSYDIAVILLICVGAFIFLVGFLGCCGACRESSCLLGLFAGLMVLLVLVQIAAAILVVVFKGEVETELKGTMNKQVGTQYGADDAITKVWDKMQQEFKCCGANNSDDWAGSVWFKNQTSPASDAVPNSCCKTETTTCAVSTAYKDGCYDGMLEWFKNHSLIVIGIGFGLAFVEIVGIVMACCVRNKINSDY